MKQVELTHTTLNAIAIFNNKSLYLSIFWGFQVHWWWAAYFGDFRCIGDEQSYFGDLGCGPNRNFAMENVHWFTRPCILPAIFSWNHFVIPSEILTTRDITSFVLPEGQKHILGLTAQDMRWFLFVLLFLFQRKSKYIVCETRTSSWFHTCCIFFLIQRPGRKAWPFCTSGRKAWSAYWSSP